MAYNDKEREALYEKAENSTAKVLCPRCGAELGYREVGNSYEVKCPTDNCLKLTVRGL